MKNSKEHDIIKFKKGELVFKQGDATNFIAFMVMTGEVELFYHDELDKITHITYVGPQQIIGEMALIHQEPYTISAKATSSTTCRAINQTEFKKLLQQEIPFISSLLKLMVNRYRSLLEDYYEEKTDNNEEN